MAILSIKDAISNASQKLGKDTLDYGTEIGRRAEGTVNDVITTTGQTVRGAVNQGVREAGNVVGTAVSGALGSAVGSVFGDSAGALAGGFISDIFGSSNGILQSPGQSVSVTGSRQITNPLQAALSRPDPLLEFYWYCIVPGIRGSYGFQTLGWEYIEEASTPFRTFETRSVFRNGNSHHYADKYSVDNLTLNFYLDSANNSMAYLKNWQTAIMPYFSPTNARFQGGGYNVPSQYKSDILIYLLSPARQSIACLQYTGCWPTNLDSLALGSAGSNRLTANVSFSVTDVFEHMFTSNGDVQSIVGSNNPAAGILNSIQSTTVNTVNRYAQSAINGLKDYVGSTISSIF